jgi:hypothetical protein
MTMIGKHKLMRAAIYAKSLPGVSARQQIDRLRRICQTRGWLVETIFRDPPGRLAKLASGKGRLALIDVLLRRKRKFDVVLLWKLSMLGHALDDVTWCLMAIHVRRRIDLVLPGDGIDTTHDDTLKRVLRALDGVN